MAATSIFCDSKGFYRYAHFSIRQFFTFIIRNFCFASYSKPSIYMYT